MLLRIERSIFSNICTRSKMSPVYQSRQTLYNKKVFDCEKLYYFFLVAVEEYKATHDDGFIITEQCQGSINNDHTSSSSQSLQSYSSSQCTESTILPSSSPSLSQLRQEEEEGEREEIGTEATHDDIVNDDIASKDKTESESETTARADAGINVTPLHCSSNIVISTPLSAIGLSGFNNDNRLDYSVEEEEKEESEDQLDHDVTVEGREPAGGDSYFTEELYYTANDETTLISDINLNAVITTKSGSHGGDVASRDSLVSDDTDMISLSPINNDTMASSLISTRDGNHCKEESTDTAGGIITVTGSVSETVAKSYQNSRYCFEERNDFECLVSSQVTSKETAEELIMTDNLHIPELSIESVTTSTYSNTEEAEIEGGAEDHFDIIQSSEPMVGTDPVNVSLVSERSSSTKQCSSCLLNEVTGSSKQRSSRRKRFNIAANFSAKGKESIIHDTILSATRQDNVVVPDQVPPLETQSPPLSLQSPLPPPLTSSPSKISLSPPSLVQASSPSFTHSLPQKPLSPLSLLPNASAPKASPQPAAPTPPSQSPHVTPAPSLTPSPLKSHRHPSSPSLSPHPQKKIASSSKKSLPKSVDLDSQIKHQEEKIEDEITQLQVCNCI